MYDDSIAHIEEAGFSHRVRLLRFASGDERLVPATVVTACDLAVGWVGSAEDLDERCASAMRVAARDRALKALGYRDRSVFEMRQLLRRDGYSSQAIDATVSSFVDSGLLDDERFAAAYVRTRRAAGRGDHAIAEELRRRGLSDAIAQVALDDDDADSEVERARRVLRGEVAKDARQEQRLVRRLISRGFSLRAAREAVRDREPESPDT